MALLEANLVYPATTITSVFDVGIFMFTSFMVEATSNSSSSTTPPPKPLFVVTPTTKGTYPVILFLHGFYLSNTFYSQLLKHIASHGYIVVAPQLYPIYHLPPPSGYDEIQSAADVTDWLLEPKGLQPWLPENVGADLQALALVGHSRGGKTAFSLAINDDAQRTTRKYSALVGIDPVAGLGKCCQVKPKILTYEPQSFNISIPITVIGTGLGSRHLLFPPCAPDGVNHKEFFNECKPPCGYFVTEDYGHMDMLDDDPPGPIGKLSGYICEKFKCKNMKGCRDPMRKSVGGIVVAFIRASLQGDDEDLVAIVDEREPAPAKLSPPKFKHKKL